MFTLALEDASARSHKAPHGRHFREKVLTHHQPAFKKRLKVPRVFSHASMQTPRRDPTAFDEFTCLAMNAYFESDDNPDDLFESLFMIAYVTVHRAEKARMHEDMRLPFVGELAQTGEALITVLADHGVCLATYRAWAFSWSMASVCQRCQKWIREQKVPMPGSFYEYKWELARYAAEVVMRGAKPGDAGLDPTLTRATHYFNPRYTSKRMTCKFRREYIRLAGGVQIGRHEFYAFPTPEEQKLMDEAHKNKSDCSPVEAKTP